MKFLGANKDINMTEENRKARLAVVQHKSDHKSYRI